MNFFEAAMQILPCLFANQLTLQKQQIKSVLFFNAAQTHRSQDLLGKKNESLPMLRQTMSFKEICKING